MLKRFFVACVLIVACTSSLFAFDTQRILSVTINTTDKQAVKEMFIADLMQEQFTITKDSEYQIVMDKEIPNILFMSLSTGRYPLLRMSLNIVNRKDTVYVTAIPTIVLSPGAINEEIHPHTNKGDLKNIQNMLYSVKSRIDGTPYEKLVPPKPAKKKPVKIVLPDLPKEEKDKKQENDNH
jgi:hypothetical protein